MGETDKIEDRIVKEEIRKGCNVHFTTACRKK